MYKVVKNRLETAAGKPVRFEATKNANGPGSIRPTYLIMHYTAGLSLGGSVSWMQNPASQASAHLVIGRDGEVVQMVEFNRRAWHAGRSAWADLTDMNTHAIGIELDNAGKLQRRADGNFYFVAQSGEKKMNPGEVVLATHPDEGIEAAWHSYTPAQLGSAVAVAQALHAHFGFIDVLGHDDVSPKRKIDPGPAFPMLGFRSQVLGRS